MKHPLRVRPGGYGAPRAIGSAGTIARSLVAVMALAALVPPLGPPGRAAAAGAVPTITVTWTGLPLHAACERLSTLLGRPVILDRRIDPGVAVSLDLRDAPADEALGRVCDAAGTGCVVLADSIRIVPRNRTAMVLAAEEARGATMKKLPNRLRAAAGASAPWTWDDGATPHDLVAAAAREGGLAIDGLDELPHDHLRGAVLPSLPLAERIDLVLLQYDRRLDWTGARGAAGKVRVAIVPCGDDGVGGPAVSAAPGAWESLARSKPAGTPTTAPTWSLEVAAPLDRLLATVAEKLGLRLELDAEGLRRRGVPAGTIVRLAVKEVSREELLDRIVGPLGLRWTIDGDALRVGPDGE